MAPRRRPPPGGRVNGGPRAGPRPRCSADFWPRAVGLGSHWKRPEGSMRGGLMPDDNTAVVTSLFDAFNYGDLGRAAATVTDDFELIDVAAGQTFRGPD